MNSTFTVHFKGFNEKAALALENMLRADIARYPARLSMDSASVRVAKPVGADRPTPTVEDKPKPEVKPKAETPKASERATK